MRMEFGCMLPHRWVYASQEIIAKAAEVAEDLGYASLWVTDHVIVPEDKPQRGHIFFDALITLAYVAALTERVKLGTSVLMPDVRNPIVVGKQVATLDALSKGRVLLGVGTGWVEEELEALGVKYEERGKRLNESVRLMRLLWTSEGPISFKGHFSSFENMRFYPKPAQGGGVPIWIGGNKPSSIRRAALSGDGWIPWAISPDEVSEGVQMIRKIAKNPRKIAIAHATPVSLGLYPKEYLGFFEEKHTILTGDSSAVTKALEAYREAGVEHFICSFRDVRVFKDPNSDLIFKQMEQFAREVAPSF